MINAGKIHTPEVEAIITKVPSWIVRWGILIFTGILIMALSVSAIVRYPETIKRPVRLQYTNDLNRTIALAEVGEGEFTRIRIGQQVLIRLTAFNTNEYPPIKGTTIAISETPNSKRQFVVSIKLDDVPPAMSDKLKDWMTGSADIITRDVTVLQRITNNLTAKIP